MTLPSLAGLALEAAGGLDRWRMARIVRARLRMWGPTWEQVGPPTLLDGVDIEVDLREQRTALAGITGPGSRGIYAPDRVSIKDHDGQRERGKPRESFPPT